jgi:putative tryptophan/tyrosine transport system substrate-binding protein
VNRREFITLLGGAAIAWPLAARAQQADRMRRIGVLMNGTATEARLQSYVAAFVQGLRQLGWNEGQNIRIDVRWNAGDADLARTYAAQLIGLMPDVILASSTTNLTVIQQATSTVPVVFVQVSDPVAQGFVASVAKPGGNLTGFSMYEFSIGGKWVDLLKAAAPGLDTLTDGCALPSDDCANLVSDFGRITFATHKGSSWITPGFIGEQCPCVCLVARIVV